MKLTRDLFALILALAPLATFAGDDVNERVAADLQGDVRIVNPRGEVEVIGWDEPWVEVTGELDELLEEFTFDRSGDTVRVIVDIEKLPVSWGDGSDLEIKVPRMSRIRFRGVSTDLELSDLRGGVSVRSVSGDVRAEGLARGFDIKTVSGSVKVDESRLERLNCRTVSGDIELFVDADRVSVGAVSGDIDLQLAAFESLRGETVSGKLEIRGRLLDQGSIEMRSVSGDMTLGLMGGVNATLEARTGPGGEIDNELTEDEPEDVFPAQSRLSAIAGDGGARISLSTVSGEIRLERE